MTMAEAGREFCQRLELKGRRKSQRLTVASDLANHIAPFFAGKTLDRVRPEGIERYVAAKRRTLAIKTIRNHVNTMHSVFELGLRKGWCQINPAKLADRPTLKKTETRIQFLDQPELEQLLATSYPDDAFGRIEPALYLTAAMTGLRQGELLGLRWRDVDFDTRKIRVVSPFVRGEFGDPKSAGSGRSVPMAERVALALGELRERSYYAHDGDLVGERVVHSGNLGELTERELEVIRTVQGAPCSSLAGPCDTHLCFDGESAWAGASFRRLRQS
jgi:integrase